MQPGQTFNDPLPGTSFAGPELVVIPSGRFVLGDSSGVGNYNERPTHAVRIDRAFALGRFELTTADWRQYARATGTPMPDDEGWGLPERRPVIQVSWVEAHAYCRWLSQVTGQRYRLPTEAEWEYAARAGSHTAYWWGEQLDSPESRPRAHCRGCASPRALQAQSAQVGQFPANAFGLYDTAGNVWEWTASAFVIPFDGRESAAAALADTGPRSVRGGAWNSGPGYLRSSQRDFKQPQYRGYALGLRVLRELP
ncbi:MAG: formylglycine-generating enzyme family protein [Pseudomonas sp.]|uniref:formylglycine-generating enzyme family protein n=1 Tax=Pseudomonas sp. TaxID=306 RepID=UPI003395AB5A